MFSSSGLNWIVLVTCEAVLATFAGGMFWYQDWQYSRPTPRPATLLQPAFGTALEVVEPMSLSNLAINAEQRPTLLHFFNPDCPCSRFNWNHVRELARKFDDRVELIAVLETANPHAVKRFEQENPRCRAVADAEGRIARQVGVYSTPQGVVLDGHGRLYFRGNYNLGRYCTAPENEFVRRAVVACLGDEPLPEFPAAAVIAQGCRLPADRQQEEATSP